jgi:hypothetical protein
VVCVLLPAALGGLAWLALLFELFDALLVGFGDAREGADVFGVLTYGLDEFVDISTLLFDVSTLLFDVSTLLFDVSAFFREGVVEELDGLCEGFVALGELFDSFV